MRRRDISRALFASAAGSLATAARPAETQTRNGRDYAQTSAEAGISIADPTQRPGCVDRYTVNAEPGKTSMVQAFNSAIKQAQVPDSGQRSAVGGSIRLEGDIPGGTAISRAVRSTINSSQADSSSGASAAIRCQPTNQT